MSLRHHTRETARHERATVLQQLGAQADDPRAWQAQRVIEESRMRAALRRTQAAAPACDKCNDQAGGCWYCGRG